MMEWTAETIGRLYGLYEQYIDCLRRDVAAANRTLGSSISTEAKLKQLTRAQFEAVLTDRRDDPEAVDLWVRRIIRGHEQEFPALRAAG